MSSQDDLDDDTNSNYSLPMPPSVTGKLLFEDGDSQGYNSDAQ
jgi:hypothetical protein